MIDAVKLEELKKLIGEKSNELDEYITISMSISCFGKTEIDEYPEDYPEDGDAILIDGAVRVKFTIYRSSASHEEFDNIEDAIAQIRRYRSRKPQVIKKHPMIIAQDKVAEYKDNSY